MIVLNIIYHNSGLFSVLSFLVWTINLFMTTMILILEPNNLKIRIVQIISIFFLLYIIYLNINIIYNDLYKFAFIIPLSINKITFLDDIFDNDDINIFYFRKTFFTRFYLISTLEIADFLSNLDQNKAYIVTFEFIYCWSSYEIGEPTIILSKPILVTNESSHNLISNFLKDRINSACNSYFLDENLIQEFDGPGILVRYSEIKIH